MSSGGASLSQAPQQPNERRQTQPNEPSTLKSVGGKIQHQQQYAKVQKTPLVSHPAPAPASTNKRNIAISLGKPSLRQRLEAYYSLISPDVVSDEDEWRRKFDLIYQKYGGSIKGEQALAAKLVKKYGDTVRLKLATSDPDHHSEHRQTGAKADSNTFHKGGKDVNNSAHHHVNDENWYELKPTQRNSGIINFSSSDFDPFAALLVSSNDMILKTNPYVSESPILDDLSKFRALLPLNDPQRIEKTQPKSKKDGSSSSGRIRTMESASSFSISQQSLVQPKKKLPPLAALAERFQAGPFALLYSAYAQRQRVRVLIRYVDCIRGTLTGYLVAFDKHMNIILKDVDEFYTARNMGRYSTFRAQGETSDRSNNNNNEKKEQQGIRGNPTGMYDLYGQCKAEREVQRRAIALEHASTGDCVGLRQRWMKQLLVRGDNVVMVWKANEERSAWPRTGKSPAGSIYGKKKKETPIEKHQLLQGERDSVSQISDQKNNGAEMSIVSPRIGTPGSLIYAMQRQQSQRGDRPLATRAGAGGAVRKEKPS